MIKDAKNSYESIYNEIKPQVAGDTSINLLLVLLKNLTSKSGIKRVVRICFLLKEKKVQQNHRR